MRKITNKKVFHNYEILQKFEAGIVLTGSEVKSIKTGQVKLDTGLILVRKNEVFATGIEIQKYKFDTTNPSISNQNQSSKKLLLNKKEIKKIQRKIQETGITCVPVSLYSKRNLIKLKIAIVRGLKKYDKREKEKRKTIDRETRKQIKKYTRRHEQI